MSKIIVNTIQDTSGNLINLPESVSDGFVKRDANNNLIVSTDSPNELYTKTIYDHSVSGNASAGNFNWTIPDFIKQKDGPTEFYIVSFGAYGSVGLRAYDSTDTAKAFAYQRIHYASAYGYLYNYSDGTNLAYMNSQNGQGSASGYNPPYYTNFFAQCSYVPAAVDGTVARLTMNAQCAYTNSSSYQYYHISSVHYNSDNNDSARILSGDFKTIGVYSSGGYKEGFIKVFCFKED